MCEGHFGVSMATDLRFEALEEVTTVPALARAGGDPSTCWKLLRGVDIVIDSASALPRFPETTRYSAYSSMASSNVTIWL